ncbi:MULTISPECIES: bifunctional diguanylate cyclase/phosphodiesterase [unclassified Halomonas]|uniref:bifunctional diguanylate cyclase/phosphodiesterase n=1 Tax=unclassified Halomonas TaxID=2609666 RepID=UPI00099095F8|nr:MULTISPECIES: EAL domain-containing protein [unclassified Halomonas]AQU83758.1 GGDEF domain-containing protein [Halomonas sp. 'Soap Lake \
MSITSTDVNNKALNAVNNYRQQRRNVIAFYVLALVVTTVLFGWLLHEQYKQEIEAAESRITARANVVSEWAMGVFAQSGQALFGLSELLAIQGMPDSGHVQALQHSLANLTLYVPMVDNVSVFGPEGHSLASGRSNRSAGLDISETIFFNALKQGEQQELITPLYWSANDQRHYLYHGRRLESPSGDFTGVVISSIAPEVFAESLEQMSVHDGESIALVDSDLKLIARHPTVGEQFTIGRKIENPETVQWIASGEPTWSINMRSPIDGRERLFRMQRVGEYSMLVAVGIDLHELLTGWRQRAFILTLVMAVVALLGAWGARHYLNRLLLAYQLHERIIEREQARSEAQARGAQMDALVHSIQDLIFVFDVEGRFSYIHAAAPEQLLIDRHEALGKHYAQVLPGPLVAAFTAVFERVQQFHQVERFEYPLTLGTQPHHFHATVSPLVNSNGQFEGVLSVNRNITEAKRAEVELQIAAAAFQTHLGILITDARGSILKVNDTFTRITGYSEAEVVGQKPRIFSSGGHNAALYRRLWKHVIKTGNWEGEIWNQRKDGELFPEWLTVSAVYSAEGTLTHYVATMSDISERKAAEQEIHQLAFYDTLTGLANRRLFMDRMGAALKELQRHQRCGALLIIDIDNFKQVNDTLGHYAGDQLLQSVARRMGKMLRDTDTLARLGSDEFAVLIEGIDSGFAQTTQLAERIAHKLLATISEPMQLAEENIVVSGSVGIAVMASNGYSEDDYLQQVDMALFQAKNSSRHRVCFFDPSMQATLLAHVKLEADLRQTQVDQQWQLYYQPQVNQCGAITGVEALLRWQHPERGMVSPGEFIPLLESSGLINDVGEWVLEEACNQLARWARCPPLNELTISVNISPLQFRDEGFLNRVEGVFTRTQAPLYRLKLEVTESLFVEARDEARDKMLALKAQGVRFSLDDFGTGYSSLAYLAHLPLDQLKIDQAFVQQVLESKANAAIVESTIALAESLNLEVIAEGVENEAQQAWLLAHDCNAFQGYLFGRPATAKAIEQLILGN